ncbi:MAG: MoaD/ThiS family protein [Novosphingobium sp.]|nr:MoaD/ThiS family protein [Novosphingobium sp.]
MAIRLVFLGRLEDAAGAGEREVAVAPTLAAVLAGLEPELASVLSGDRIRLARNGELVAPDAAMRLADGDELAFLPPVSGG